MNDNNIEKALNAIHTGQFVVVVDDLDRENEGDLIIAAEAMTPEKMAFMVRHTSGIVCVALTEERAQALQLPPMVARNSDAHHTAFTVSVDLKLGTTTGISANDRSATVKALADPASKPDDFSRPGHVFPLIAKPQGVLQRPGHTEAACDLTRLAGLQPSGVLCELVNDAGSILRGEALIEFARHYDLPLLSIAELIAYRRRSEKLIEWVAQARMPTEAGIFGVHVYRSILDGSEHLALVKGEIAGRENVLVRVHSECLTGDVLGSLRCDCGNQLKMALMQIAQAGAGVLVYLRGHEGRGIGLAHKIQAYGLQDLGRDTLQANLDLGLPADARQYDIGAQILTHLGVNSLLLMSNNPAKFTELMGYPLKIAGRVPLEPRPNPENLRYLRTKTEKMGHLRDIDSLLEVNSV
ncbi:MULTISPECIES: bifunctional 3,4-dihydroxy-2-butanone-4-phosphate synthase/GTP cyclohydrolase II [Methylomonas]|uniref:Riboflavin biosynthesis protein RibBA n=1 Tax=Methylomonas koyamae TaxID=702114 RepID=A0A177NIY4_9GAMM|nr:bifunctional 3,4-dihydroxy-2-butanone-4-phosphate synthase/GTP cyclohydrolase II [Methylomonas koyamae]OAI17831.1 bifunctional 3,4-dihydroxy-2-butanone 4-phosphate synthase/GTP cyclohydrolase II [Methylomonas koyamae]